jgi:TonB family protein
MPDLAFSTPSGFDFPKGARVGEGDLASGGGGAPGGGATAPHEERLAGETRGAPDGKGLAGEGGGGAAQIAGSLAATRGGGPGAGDGPGGAGSGTGRGGTFAYILGRIEAAKRYPEEARRLGHRGTVAVRFRIGPDGAVAAAEVAASSGSSLLDAASLETVRRAAPLPLTPGWLLIRISYGLTESRP